MNNFRKLLELLFLSLIISTAFFNYKSIAADSTIVEKYGQIKTNGNKIVDKYNNPLVLRGMSLFWSQWKGQYYNADCIKWLYNDWKCSVVRAAMAVESGGYLTNPSTEKAKIKTVIDACIDLGIYVIVDWHDHNAQDHLSQSISFFEEIANEYGDKPNIIYEIFNEPEQDSWNDVVKPYADSVISHIRKIDPDNLIIVGTPTWSQDVDVAVQNPLNDENLAYVFHFYAATHNLNVYFLNKLMTALNNNYAIFVSEFGTCEANAMGAVDTTETEKWFTFMENHNISWCNWAIEDKAETAAALKPGSSATGGWLTSDLTESGLYIRNKLNEFNSEVVGVDKEESTIPAKFILHQNYPNPFNPATIVRYDLPEGAFVKISIYNLLGQRVEKVIDGYEQAGVHVININMMGYSTGVYLLNAQLGSTQHTIKLSLIK